jgi:O-antigen/teichoic acid export membrane protein
MEKLINFLEKITRTDIHYVLKGYFWYGVEYSISLITGLATAVAFANLLPPQTYGTFKYILSLLPFLGISTLKRLNDSLTISVAKGFEGDLIRVFKTKIKWGLWGSLVGIGISVYYFYQDNSILGLLVLILAFFIPLFNAPYVFSNFLVGKKDFKMLAIVNAIGSLAYAIGIITAILTSKNIFVVVLAYFSINFLIQLASFLYVFYNYKPNKKEEPNTIKYGKQISVLGIINTTASYVDNLLVFHYLGAAELAAYAFIKKMPEQIKDLPSFITTLSMPKFATKNIGDAYTKKETIRKSFFVALAVLGIVLVYIILAPFLFKIFFPVYQNYAPLSQLYALSLPIGIFGTLLLNFVEATRKIRTLVKFNFIFPLTKIAIIVLAINLYGFIGLVWSFMATRFLYSALITYFFCKNK